jgi:hypothetical protein
VAVPAGDYLWFIDLALAEMVGIVRQLGDAGANRRPAVAGANSPYAILTHCLGVMEFWGGVTVAGRPVERDRGAEFEAAGQVDALAQRVRDARRRLRQDMAGLESLTVPAGAPRPGDAGRPYSTTKGGVLLHIMEELFQHLGHMELTRDMLQAAT